MNDSIDDLDWDSGCWDVIQAQSDYIEFDWFARDIAGHVAAISSFGVGPSPQVVRASRIEFNAVLGVFARLPETTTAILDPSASGRTDDWQQYARCGLFGYDNADIGGRDQRYRRIASPRLPLRFVAMSVLPAIAERIPILPLVFAESSSIPFTSIPE